MAAYSRHGEVGAGLDTKFGAEEILRCRTYSVPHETARKTKNILTNG